MTNRTALVTGASSPLAAAIIELLAGSGFRVVGTSLDEADAPSAIAHLVADLSVPSEAARVVDAAVERLGGLDAVVAVAGAMPIGRIEDTTPDDLDRALRGSFTTFFTVAQAAVTRMRRGGAIVALSSVNATLAAPGVAAYAASKGAVEGLVRQLALDQAARGIRVNAVAPGLIDTGQLADGGEAGKGYPRGSAVTADEVAQAVVFLASPSSSGITGVVLPVDAGLGITSPATFLREDLLDRLHPKA